MFDRDREGDAIGIFDRAEDSYRDTRRSDLAGDSRASCVPTQVIVLFRPLEDKAVDHRLQHVSYLRYLGGMAVRVPE